MNALLLGSTLSSLAAAVIMAVVTWRVLGREARRSAARVRALAAAAQNAAAAPVAVPISPPTSADVLEGGERQVLGDPPSRRLFAAFEHPSSPARALVAAAVTGVTLVGLVAVSVRGGGPAPAPESIAEAPLELLALSVARSDDGLVIHGLVRNPFGAPRRNGTLVRVTLMDGGGRTVATIQGRLEATALLPGDESPFVLAAAGVPAASRYRLGFRTEDGTLVAHVDRRTPADEVARVPRPSGPRGGGAP